METEDRRKCRRTGEREVTFFPLPEERFITRQPNEGDEETEKRRNEHELRLPCSTFLFREGYDRSISFSLRLPLSPHRQPPRTFHATFPLPRRSFSLPLERDSTKDRAFVLTNPPVRVRRLVDGPSFLPSSFPVCERRSSGDPSTLRTPRRSLRSLRPLSTHGAGADVAVASVSAGSRGICGGRRRAGGFNLLVVLSKSPPSWPDVNTSG